MIEGSNTQSEEMRGLIDKTRRISGVDIENNSMDLMFNHGLTSFDNPVSLYFARNGFDNKLVFEGLIKTYPIDKTIQYIRDYFNLGDAIKKRETASGQEVILVNIADVDDNIDIIKKALDVCGYHLSTEVESVMLYGGVKYVTLQFEAKNQDDASKEIRSKEAHLYHLTPLFNKNKILRDGFSPRCRNTMFNYPNRIYFLKGSVDEDDIIELGQQLTINNKSFGNDNQYVIFDVDLDKISEDTKMYIDPNYTEGIFISDNLKPNCIKRVGYINFSMDEPQISWN